MERIYCDREVCGNVRGGKRETVSAADNDVKMIAEYILQKRWRPAAVVAESLIFLVFRRRRTTVI